MTDLRSAELLDVVPESIADDSDVVAMAQALDPEIRSVADHIIDTIILPRINEQPVEVLDAIAWSMRFNELSAWETADLTGKRALLANVLAMRKGSGTRWSVRRMLLLLRLSASVIEWWQETPAAAPYTYKVRVDASDAGVPLAALLQIPELVRRFDSTRNQLSQLGIELQRSTTLLLRPALTSGVISTIGSP